MKRSLLLLFVPSVAFAQIILPPAGEINPAVTQDNIKTTICVSGWTKTVRPPNTYTAKLKQKQLDAAGVTDKNLAHYEEDHLISLELGGHPTSEQNLWPELYTKNCGAKKKDRLENYLHREVCSGRMPLSTAQKIISTDWISAYKQFIDKNGCSQ